MKPDFLSQKRGERPMGVYICPSKRLHVVYDFFDVCLCLDGFKQLHEGVTNLVVGSDSVASSYVLRFACASVSIRADDILHLYQILDEALDRIVLLDLEKELRPAVTSTSRNTKAAPRIPVHPATVAIGLTRNTTSSSPDSQ